MLNKTVLNKSTPVELALPDGGFSHNFINTLSSICSENKELYSSYFLVKRVGDDVSFLFGFLFDENCLDKNSLMEKVMSDILNLFSDDVAFEGICLNENSQMKHAMQSITEPFYCR